MIYLASPLFTEGQRKRIQKVVAALRALNREVYSPMEHQILNAWDMSNDE